MRPYVSIDIETTGLNPETCQILEIGAILDDWKTPVEHLPRFHCYVVHKQIKGEAYALAMNAEILRRIAEPRKYPEYLFLAASFVGERFAEWLQSVNIDPKDKVLAAGKNFAGFDLQFFNKLGENYAPFKDYVTFKHRVIDPGSMFFDPVIDLDGPPDSKTCMARCGLGGDVAHTALEDAEAVIRMVRNRCLPKKFATRQS
jgi:oligoribonuclease